MPEYKGKVNTRGNIPINMILISGRAAAIVLTLSWFAVIRKLY